MPMMISWSGNSSVATLPTMFDLNQKGKLSIQKGSLINKSPPFSQTHLLNIKTPPGICRLVFSDF